MELKKINNCFDVLKIVGVPNLSRLVIRSEGTKESRSASRIPSGSNWATW